MNSEKKLNLSKYAYLDYRKGDIFAWLNCNANFQAAAKDDLELRGLTPWRYEDEEESILDDESEFENKERYDMIDPSKDTPDQMKAGIRVGEYSKLWAIQKFPDHDVAEVRGFTNVDNVKKTKELLKEENIIIFEATFEYNSFNIRTDILVKTGDEVKIIEVKATSSPKEVHAYDVFFQKEIIERGNPEYKGWDYSLLILDKTYIHSVKFSEKEVASRVFVNIDYTTNGTISKRNVEGIEYKWNHYNNIHWFNNLDLDREYPSFIEEGGRTTTFTFPLSQFLESSLAIDLRETFDDDLNRIKEIQSMDKPPVLEFEDRNNKFMKSDYMTWALQQSGAYDVEGMSVFDLRGFRFSKKTSLMREGKLDIDNAYVSDISPKPFDSDSYDTHNTDSLINKFLNLDKDSKSIPKYSAIIQKHFYNRNDILEHKGFKEELSIYSGYPIYMYDFETANLAIPEADGTTPYEQVVYQFSIHVILDPEDFDFETGKNIVHYEWLAEDRDRFNLDAWKEFIIPFKKHGEGIYVAWNMSFEKGCLSRAQLHELDVEDQDLIKHIHDTTVDLMVPFKRKLYYHKDLHGSYSIKYAGPHFANEIQYSDLDNVHRGDQSAAVAKKWLRENTDESNRLWNNMRHDMLKYCEYDTLLMVAILQRLKEKFIW